MNAPLVLATVLALAALAQDPAPKPAPRVEVVFVLDTTGSMGGLLEGAKRKIWSIATEISRGKPKPDVFVGLVAYRDRGDEYVTRVEPLTGNLDKIYGELLMLQPGGGGDGPEDVRKALHEAVSAIAWSKDPSTLRLVYLVGDAPPHLDYADVPTVEAICESAVKAGLVINAIRCGGDAETEKIWQDIARRSEGQYASIAQNGGVVAVATPFDKELAELGTKLGATAVYYGDEKKRDEAAKGERMAAKAPAADAAARAGCKAEGRAYSSDDLVDAVRLKRVKLEDVKPEELPEELRKLGPAERLAYLEAKGKERDALRARIVELTKSREAHIAEVLKKAGAVDAFDAVVLKALHAQAAKKGIAYEGARE